MKRVQKQVKFRAPQKRQHLMENEKLINHIFLLSFKKKLYPTYNSLSLNKIYMIICKTVTFKDIMNCIDFTLYASQQHYYFKRSSLVKDHLKLILYVIHVTG